MPVRWSAWLGLGSAAGFIAVAAGAWGAHALAGRLDAKEMALFETASRYLMVHALALIGTGLAARAGLRTGVAGWAFLAGSALFSGSLFGLALTGWKPLGAVTPFGGLALLAGWAVLGVQAFRARAPEGGARPGSSPGPMDSV